MYRRVALVEGEDTHQGTGRHHDHRKGFYMAEGGFKVVNFCEHHDSLPFTLSFI